LDNEAKTNLLHGEAIAAGMIMESYISWQKGLLTTSEHQEIKQTIKNIFETISFNENDIQPILDLLIHDKKNEYGKIQFALLDGIGQININQEADNELIIKSFADYKN
jgi:3-dehydroquinate synthase